MPEKELPPLDLREQKKRRREQVLIAVLTVFFLLLTIAEFRLTKLSNTLPFVNSIFFFGLLNLNLFVLMGLIWLVFRNIGKLFIERRRRILGSRLKTKLVISFLAFSIIPTLLLFFISSLYINSSFDKWFSIKIQNTLQASLEITRTYYRNADQDAMHFATHLSTQLSEKLSRKESSRKWIQSYLNRQRDLLAIDSVEFYSDAFDERIIAQVAPTENRPHYYPRLALDLLDRGFAGENVSVIQHIGSGDLIRSLVPVRLGQSRAGVLAVNAYIPVSLINKVDEIASVFDDYKDTNPLKYPVKTTYFVILVMITLVIIFVAIWIGLYMARELTVPVEKLVEGVRQVGSGNLDIKIASAGRDEISVLVDSFNRMTQDLRENRRRLVETSSDLEERRQQLEAVLANVGTGVMAVNQDGKVTTLNRAAAQLLEIESKVAVGKSYQEILDDEAGPLYEVISRAFKITNAAESRSPEVAQWNYRRGDTTRALAAIATPLLEGERGNLGVVAVIDDLTHLIKAQREMAWREVARRIAHEIKNPLTPIKLSAQRLKRRLGHFRGKDGELLNECTTTIIRHTDELKEMVNEFSSFARLPEAQPAPHQLNEAIEEVVDLYRQAHADINFTIELESRVPVFEFDRDQIKRVMINLFDNSVAELKQKKSQEDRKITIHTHFNEELKMAVISFQDNGTGMPDDIKARVFEPYFSTKSEGTGLGLAIVKRIINDHDGFIRVHSTPGEGTQFLIELPTTIKHSKSVKEVGIER